MRFTVGSDFDSDPRPGTTTTTSRVTLPRILSRPEVWAFGFTTFLLWPQLAFTVQGLSGRAAPLVWAAAGLLGGISMLQLRALAAQWPLATGGTGTFIARLFADRPRIARYGAFAYFHTWALVVPAASATFAGLVSRMLTSYSVSVRADLIQVLFLLLMFTVARAGTRALSVLQVTLFVPAFGVFVAMVVMGLAHPGNGAAVATAAEGAGIVQLGGAFFLVLGIAFGAETAASFSPEAPDPETVRRCLATAAALGIPLLAGAALVVARHAPAVLPGQGLYDAFVAITTPFWGEAAPALVTFLLATMAILAAATALAVAPRVLHQQAVDGLFGGWLGQVLPRTIFKNPLLVCALVTLPFSFFTSRTLLSLTLSEWAAAIILLHVGIWLNRSRPYAKWPLLALILAAAEVAALIAGWPLVGSPAMLLGLLSPLLFMGLDRFFAKLPVASIDAPGESAGPTWLLRVAVPVEIVVVFVLVVVGMAGGWALGRNSLLGSGLAGPLFVLATLLAVVLGVAWSAWTSTRVIESLHEARREIGDILAAAMDPVMSVDGQGRIRASNLAAEQLFGAPRSALRGRYLGDFVEGLTGVPMEWTEWSERRVIRADGTLRQALIVARPLRRSLYPRFTVTVNDLTDRKQAERELALGQERLALALSVADQYVWDLNLVTDEFRIVTSGREVIGYSPEEVSANREWWNARVHPEDRAQVELAMQTHLVGRSELFEITYRMRHRSGDYRWMLSRGRVVEWDGDGRPTRVIGTTMDTNDRHTLELQLMQSQKMEALGQLAGGVAHDFNNALQAILGAADLLSLSPEKKIGDCQADLGQVRVAAERAAGLTRQLLTFSRQRATRPEDIDLNAMVMEVARLIRRLLGPGIRIETVLASELGHIRADPALLEHAIINLAVNGRDAMPSGGRLILATRALPSANGEVCLEVADNGEGMEPEVIERVFEPFFTTKPPGRGTGLGLPMVYGFMQQAGGRVEVESTPGAGSTFRLVFPVKHGAAPATAPVEAAPARGTEVILLVDDEEGVRSLCGSALQELGYTVLDAANGEQAISILQAQGDRVALLLTDVAMPGMGGLALGRWAAAHFPGLPIGYLSGFLQGSEDDLMRLDQSRLLIKPFRLEALAELVRRLLDPAPVARSSSL